MITWKPDVKRFYIQSKTKFTKKGKPVSIPVTVRKLFVVVPNPITTSGHYRIVKLVRKGETTYSVSALPRVEGSIWANPNGKCEPWFTIGEKYKRTDDKPMTKVQILHWLKTRMGLEQATLALDALETAIPTNMANETPDDAEMAMAA